MTRLTYKNGHGKPVVMIDGREHGGPVAERLAAFEDLGKEPDELEAMLSKKGGTGRMNTDTEILACCDCKYSEIREVPGMGKLTCCTHKPYNSIWTAVAPCPIGHDKRKLALEEQSAAK